MVKTSSLTKSSWWVSMTRSVVEVGSFAFAHRRNDQGHIGGIIVGESEPVRHVAAVALQRGFDGVFDGQRLSDGTVIAASLAPILMRTLGFAIG